MTTTTYAVLGLLCLRSWSAYELTQQMGRSLRFMWPRAESGIYREPQKLLDMGYATATEVAAGPRRKKVLYSATPAGRRALQEWLRTPSAPPQFESEAMLKFFFSDQSTLDDARRALGEIAAHAETLRQAFGAITGSHEERHGPFPDRQHIGAVTGRFVFDYARTLARWAAWASGQVHDWPDTGPAAAVLGDMVQRDNARLAGIEDEDWVSAGASRGRETGSQRQRARRQRGRCPLD